MSQNPSKTTVILADYQSVGIAHSAQMSEHLAKYDRVFTPKNLKQVSDETLIQTFGDQFSDLLGQDTVEAREKRRQLTTMYQTLQGDVDGPVRIMGIDHDVQKAVKGITDPEIQKKMNSIKMSRHVENFASPDLSKLKVQNKKLPKTEQVEFPRDDMWMAMVEDGMIDKKRNVVKSPQFSQIPGMSRTSGVENLEALEGYYETSLHELGDEIASTKLEQFLTKDQSLMHLPGYHAYLNDKTMQNRVLTGEIDAQSAYVEVGVKSGVLKDHVVKDNPIMEAQKKAQEVEKMRQERLKEMQELNELAPVKEEKFSFAPQQVDMKGKKGPFIPPPPSTPPPPDVPPPPMEPHPDDIDKYQKDRMRRRKNDMSFD